MATEVHPELLNTFVTDLGIITYADAHWRCERFSNSLDKWSTPVILLNLVGVAYVINTNSVFLSSFINYQEQGNTWFHIL